MSDMELKDTAIRLLLDGPQIQACVNRYAQTHGINIFDFRISLACRNQYNQDAGVWGSVTYWEGVLAFNFTAKHQMKRLNRFCAWLREFGMTSVQVRAHSLYFKMTWKEWLP